ncbi:carboxylesterase/lipase family protein [Kribbella jiaozuonensis]|uniref:carboxylesterase/lipase family protein n=1 Tax=Kribbella jiaozuonensis TaxID=2575441 RepID=UPI00192DBA6C|nr:carboxylesterase family protein [Kribbella jiaozuonensis]
MNTTISQGQLRGRRADGIDAYLGIPYATANRFEPPQPAPPWTGMRDATQVGPAAPQPRSRLADVIGDRSLEQSEDCLNLNVWSPSEPAGTPRPVLVFLHGGGFSTGSGGLAWYDGARLARRGDFVVVTINYRLGALGYLRLEHDNLGLLDQLQALRWVQENIAAFGGDPAAVTVAGQSGGALSIVAMRKPDGLFQRAILESPPLGLRPQTQDVAAAMAAEFVEILGSDPYTAAVDDILAAQLELAVRHPGPIPPFHLVGDELTALPDVDVLIGWCRDEAKAYGAGPEVTESLFSTPIKSYAEQLESAWVYRFDWSAPGNPLGACHNLELPFVFGNLDACRDAAMLTGAADDGLTAMVDVVQTAWTAFVRDGNPGWPASDLHVLDLP